MLDKAPILIYFHVLQRDCSLGDVVDKYLSKSVNLLSCVTKRLFAGRCSRQIFE